MSTSEPGTSAPLSADETVRRLIGIPGPMRKRRIDADQVMLVVQVVLLDFRQRVSPPPAVAFLDGQHVQDPVPLAGINSPRQQDLDRRRATEERLIIPVGVRIAADQVVDYLTEQPALAFYARWPAVLDMRLVAFGTNLRGTLLRILL